jgi:hypothetical protein
MGRPESNGEMSHTERYLIQIVFPVQESVPFKVDELVGAELDSDYIHHFALPNCPIDNLFD